jgi:uncharacterized protein YaaQ
MKLILAVIRDTDDGPITSKLVERGYRVTRLASTGGFLRKGNVTLMIGVDEEQLEEVFTLVEKTASPPEPGHHRATMFVINATSFEQI